MKRPRLMVMPTIYDPEIHGEMTDEERYEYNRRLMDEIPESDPDDAFDGIMYRSLMSLGHVAEAQEYHDGYRRDCVRRQIASQKKARCLYTEAEVALMLTRQEQIHKEADRILADTGITADDLL